MSARVARLLLTLGILLVYARSLDGDWVWDDHNLIAGNPLLREPAALWWTSVWESTGRRDDLYRPLVMSSFIWKNWIIHWPIVDRTINLALHLAASLAVFGMVLGSGRRPAAAALATALFAFHPGVTEAVAWITGRHDLLPAVCVILAWGALSRGREWAAAALLGAAVFCKEPYLLAPVVPLVWGWSQGRHVPVAVLGSAAFSGHYLVVRELIDLPLPASAALTEPVGALGALLCRALELAFVPGSADALPLYTPSTWLGVVGLLIGLGVLIGSRGRPWLAPLGGALVLLAPTAPASAQLGVVADRYFYLLFAALVPVVAYGLDRLPPRALVALVWVPLGLGVSAGLRATDWRDDTSVFSASYQRNPQNAQAAFHLGVALQRAGDCERAAPLLAQGGPVDRRASTNLQACLLHTGKWAEAAALGEALWREHQDNINVARNTARALTLTGELDRARGWAETAVRLDPKKPRSLILLGNIQGQLGQFDDAERSFRAALDVEPGSPLALHGLAAVARRRAE